MKKLFIISLVFASCKSVTSPPVNTDTVKNKVSDSINIQPPPAWLRQNIDTSSCDLILCQGMEMVKVGKQYTATYSMVGQKWVMSDKARTGLDFDYRGMPFMFKDSCALKASLRDFIRLKMVQNISEGLYKSH